MPELIEVEQYRQAAEAAVGRRLAGPVQVPPGYVRGGPAEELAAVLPGAVVRAARRHGKVLLLDLDTAGEAPVLGLRFGMTGRLVVDGVAPVSELVYGSSADRPEWDRLVLPFDGGGVLRINDPRRLGWVELDPDLSGLGPDAATVSAAEVRVALDGAATPLKARLLDQTRLAGIGNLIADEVLWRARLSPLRLAGGLTPAESAALARSIRDSIRRLSEAGGSHRGALQPYRARGGPCPRCGAALLRSRIGGRATLWCPAEQH